MDCLVDLGLCDKVCEEANGAKERITIVECWMSGWIELVSRPVASSVAPQAFVMSFRNGRIFAALHGVGIGKGKGLGSVLSSRI